MTDATRPPLGLIVWLALSCVGFLIADPAPPVPVTSPDEQAAFDRSAQKAAEDARTWMEQRGDLVVPWAQARGHLAIVVDDVGRELVDFEQLLGLRHRLTFSVLPGAAYAPGVILRATADGRRPREIWLHLPMEPHDGDKMREGLEASEVFLLADDSPPVLQEKTRRAIAAVPLAVGVNNHMGSKLTEDRAAMDAVMAELARAGLAFLDSRTTAQTRASEAAEAAGVVHVSRDAFLDDDPRPEAIAQALRAAIEASTTRPTVAIVHPSPAAVRILRTELARAHEAGVSVFPLSEVIAHRHATPGDGRSDRDN